MTNNAKNRIREFQEVFPTFAVFTPFAARILPRQFIHSKVVHIAVRFCGCHVPSYMTMMYRGYIISGGERAMIDNALFLVMSTASRAIDVKSVFIDFPPLSNSFNLNCLYSSAAVLHNFPFRADDERRRHRWNTAQTL